MKRALRWYDTLTINTYWLGLSATVDTITPLVAPLLVQQFIGEEAKATFYGGLRLATLMVALLVQALFGMLSDRSTFRMGRRRPFILLGTLLSLVIIGAVGLSTNMSGMAGYWFLLTMLILLSISTNISQAAQNGFIPDLVPENKRGLFSGIKTIFEVPLPLILVSFTIAKLISVGRMWAGLLSLAGILILVTSITMLVRENRLSPLPSPLDWRPFLRLVLMTAVFSIVIWGMGSLVKMVLGLFSEATLLNNLLASSWFLGFLAMSLAIGLGVWISIQIGVGKEAFGNKPFIWWVINRLAFLVGVNNLASFTIFFLQARLGFVQEKAAQPASLLTTFVGIFILLSALPSGWFADRYGHKKLVLISGLLAAFGTAVAILLPSLPLIYLGGCLIGMATGIFFASNWALGTAIVPPGEAGRYLGISNLAGAGAGAIGAYIGGPIADQISRFVPQIPGMGYLVLFAIYGSLFLVSTLALTGIRITGKAPIQPGMPGAGIS